GEGEGAGTPVKAFRNYEKAAAFCRDQELKRRAKANPFDGGNPYRGIAEVSSFDADRFHDWLLDAGIEPPEKSRSKTFTLGKWSAWWKKVRKDLTDYQQAKVWEALDKVCFCDIIELEPPGE